jgi:hypothetical protein
VLKAFGVTTACAQCGGPLGLHRYQCINHRCMKLLCEDCGALKAPQSGAGSGEPLRLSTGLLRRCKACGSPLQSIGSYGVGYDRPPVFGPPA